MAYMLGQNLSNPIATNAGRGGGGGGMRRPSGPMPLSPQQELERQRKLSEDAIANIKGMYQGQAMGQNQPYGQDVVARMFGQASDLTAGQARGQSDLIRQSFARRGMSNSGGQMASLAGAQNRAAANLRRAQSQIQNQAALENYGAAERGRAALAGLLQPELAFRSRYEVTGEDPLTAALAKLLAGNQGGGRVFQGVQERPRSGGYGPGPDLFETFSPQQQAPQQQAPQQRASVLSSAPDGLLDEDMLASIAQHVMDSMPGLGGM